MRIENPTFALTPEPSAPSVTAGDPSPDVTRTEPAAVEQLSSADKAGLVDGAADSDVVYVRGWRLRKLWLWQALAAACLALFVIMVVAYSARGGSSDTPVSSAVIGGNSSGGITTTTTTTTTTTPSTTTTAPPGQLHECSQPDCVFQAADIVRLMNFSADPCTDFYSYACGNFEQVAPHRRSSRSVYSVPDWLTTQNNERVVELLEDRPDAYSPDSALWKVKTLYSSCLDDYANLRNAGKRMVKLIDGLGGLDLWGTWDPQFWLFNNTFRKVHDEHWTDAMMNFFWVRNPRDPSKNLLRITKSGLGVPYLRAYMNPDLPVYEELLSTYQETMLNVMGMLVRDSGVNVTALNRSCGDRCLDDFVSDVLDFETKLANISLVPIVPYTLRRRSVSPRSAGGPLHRWFGRRRRRRQAFFRRRLRMAPSTQRLSLADLSRVAPQVDWVGLLEDLMGANIVTASTWVEIPRDGYIQKLNELIRTENKRTVHHYLVWTVIRRHLMAMSADYVYQRTQMDVAFQRGRRPPSRPEFCRSSLDQHMPEAVGMLFVKDHIGLETLHQTANFTGRLVAAFSDSLRPWMTEAVRRRANGILGNTSFHYGFPKWIMDERELDSYFEPLGIAEGDFFRNMKNMDLFKRIQLRNKLKYGNNKQRWTIEATHARILSSLSGGFLAVPAGMMQTPIFSPSVPSYINTAALGSLVAEHLAAFTVTNNDSATMDSVWWDGATYRRYEPYRSCVLDLYRNHTVRPAITYMNAGEIPLRPERQASVLVSRHYALSVAFEHHRRLLEESGGAVRLPGLRHETSDQTFFLAFAQARCVGKRSATTDYLLYRLAGIVPAQIEVNTAVYNQASFRSAFQCGALPGTYDHQQCAIPSIEEATFRPPASALQPPHPAAGRR
ncbi:Endothelin-converting enzyme 1 [Amphibalanus amphitrite]|uniref:Endothelin-converting enzyme 1 n=2 Tax=Amphibalanus amphitrite TaxID=1232801 RepID=A0A6A4WRP1_AMPAM|nr:Endothelin-converting enzyme 1 [Amphibalanus amphitrite]